MCISFSPLAIRIQQPDGSVDRHRCRKRASASHITVIMPYFGYARQDRKARPRQPITSKLVASLLETAGANRVITMELHATQIQGFFDIPADDISAISIIGKYFQKKDLGEIVVVSPDHGGVTRARRLAEILHAPIAIIDKRRPKPNVAEAMNLIGEVDGKTAIIVDDIVDTGGHARFRYPDAEGQRGEGHLCKLRARRAQRPGD